MVASRSRQIARNSEKIYVQFQSADEIFSVKAKNRCIFPTDPCLRPPFGGKPSEFDDEIWRQKTRVLGLPDGEEIMPLAFFVLTQYRRVTDGRTDRRTDRQTDTLRSVHGYSSEVTTK